jgi:hypothetical protein
MVGQPILTPILTPSCSLLDKLMPYRSERRKQV